MIKLTKKIIFKATQMYNIRTIMKNIQNNKILVKKGIIKLINRINMINNQIIPALDMMRNKILIKKD
jgi:hypothetical protein